jgi:hypothetical protein
MYTNAHPKSTPENEINKENILNDTVLGKVFNNSAKSGEFVPNGIESYNAKNNEKKLNINIMAALA